MSCQFLISDFNSQLKAEGVKVYSIENRNKLVQIYSRRNVYTICLLSGNGIFEYDMRAIKFDGPVLLITRPDTSYTWKLESTNHPTYTSIFTQTFFDANCFRWIEQSQLFSETEPPVFKLTLEQHEFFNCLFQKMVGAHQSGYRFRNDLIQNQICVLLHSAIHLKRTKTHTDAQISAGTPAALYVELAEMQFPAKAQVLHFN